MLVEMNFAFRGHQLIAHWIPGFVLVCLLYVCDRHYRFGYFTTIVASLTTQPPKPEDMAGFFEKSFIVLAFVAVVFVIGQFIDALRDILETVVACLFKAEIKWKKIAKMNSDERQAWDDYFFSYYVFSANMAIGAIPVVAGCSLCSVLRGKHWIVAFISFSVMTVVFAWDALILRPDVRDILLDSKCDSPSKNSQNTTPGGTPKPAGEAEEGAGDE
jgi:hypothetical protein